MSVNSMADRVGATLQTAAILLVAVAPATVRADLADALQTLADARAAPGGQAELATAWKEASSSSIDQFPQVLQAMGDATALGENWLRTAADAIAERCLKETGSLPASMFEGYVTDASGPPRARWVAYEWLQRIDAEAAKRLLPTMLDDPSIDLRYDAVAAVIESAEATDDASAKSALLHKALAASRNVEQLRGIAKALEELGTSVDLATQMGFVRNWRVIGPFDNVDLIGFASEYSPERNLELNSAEGRDGVVAWRPLATDDKLGVVNLNEAVGNEKLVCAYALATLRTQHDQQVEFRLGAPNAFKLWVNGQQLAAYEIYHSGAEIDQYVASAKLFAGRPNTVLVKICQNAKAQPWEQDWQFQLRVTDHLGGPADVRVEQSAIDAVEDADAPKDIRGAAKKVP